jgi:peroxiredoxin
VSRFCGPVTDLVADLAAQYGDRADFIHIEIYADFQAGKVNQAALDWLQTGTGDLREPWTFLIGADGRIVGSWDTVVTRGEIEPLLRALPIK